MAQSGLLGDTTPALGSVAVVAGPGGTVLRLAGEVDTAVVDRFDRQRDRPEAVSGVEAIDASAVTFIDLAGVRLILRCARESARAGQPAVLRHSTPMLDRLLLLTGLQALVPRAGQPTASAVPAPCPVG